MNPALWDDYKEDEVNEKIRYWVDLWESVIDSLSDTSSSDRFELMNPHLLVQNIIDEIVFNDFQNADNRAFFKQQLEFFLEHDPATNKLFAADLALIRREFGGKRLAYLAQLCQSVEQAFLKSDYLSELYLCLRGILASDAWAEGDAETIQTISQCMIVELHLLGYSLDNIKSFPENVFDRSTGFFFNHRFDLALNEEDFVRDGQLDVTAYRDAIQTRVDALTVEQRLDSFSHYFSPESKVVYLLYQIEGLKGDNLDITIGNVNLYSPKTKRYIKSVPGENPDHLRNEELFGCPDEEHCTANAAVKVAEFDTPAAEAKAVAAIDSALDLFRAFVSSEVPFAVMSHKYIRVSPEGDYWGGGERGRTGNDPAYRHFRALDITRFAEHGFDDSFFASAAKLLFGNDNGDTLGQRLSYSLHWYRKAEEAETPEDRLLGYWIVLENIVSVQNSTENVLLPPKTRETKFALIRELIPSLECYLYLASSAAMLYHKLVGMITTRTNGRSHLDLPVHVAATSQLSAAPGTQIDLKTFVTHLQEIADAINRKVVRDQIQKVRSLHTDTQSAKGQIEQRTTAVKQDLLLIYRFRNRIVHNAHYDDTVLPHYIEKLRQYAGAAVRQVLYDLSTHREPNIEQSLMRYYVQLQRIQERLSKGSSVDFLTMDI